MTEVEAAVADGRADPAVHSAKDLPSTMPAPRAGRLPPRADPVTAWWVHAGGPAGGRPGRHRVGAAPGPAGLPAARPHVQRPAGQHGPPRGRRPTPELSGPWWWPWRRWSGWVGRGGERGARPPRRPPPGGAGGARRGVRSADRHTRGCSGPSTTSRGTGRAGRAGLSGGAGRGLHLPLGALAETLNGDGGRPSLSVLRVSGMMASRDGRADPHDVWAGTPNPAAALGRALLDGGGGRAPTRVSTPPGGGGAETVTVYLVGPGPGDPGLITRRGAELLGRAEVVLLDRLVTLLCSTLCPRAPRGSTSGRVPMVPRSGEARGAATIRGRTPSSCRARAAPVVVVRLKGGDPFLFGAGGRRPRRSPRAGVYLEVVPGVTSAFGVPAPQARRSPSGEWPRRSPSSPGASGSPGAPVAPDWDALARAGGTFVIMMGMAGRAEIAQALVAGDARRDAGGGDCRGGRCRRSGWYAPRWRDWRRWSWAPPPSIVVGAVAALGPFPEVGDR